jgi:hypothetical protein
MFNPFSTGTSRVGYLNQTFFNSILTPCGPFSFSSESPRSSGIDVLSGWAGSGLILLILFAAAKACATSKVTCQQKTSSVGMREEILGPKLKDCPALVLPCTTARYITTMTFCQYWFAFKVEVNLTVIESGVLMTGQKLPPIPQDKCHAKQCNAITNSENKS